MASSAASLKANAENSGIIGGEAWRLAIGAGGIGGGMAARHRSRRQRKSSSCSRSSGKQPNGGAAAYSSAWRHRRNLSGGSQSA
jgi:hypothetical protein